MNVANHAYIQFIKNRADVRRFVALLLGVWIVIGVLLSAYDSFTIPLYYILIYLAFLLLLELGSAYLLRLRNRKWLNVLIGIGFIGWSVCLYSVFSY